MRYPVSELAARYGASVEKETSDPGQAYATAEGSGESGRRTGHACPGARFFKGHPRTVREAWVLSLTTELCLSPTSVPSDTAIAEGHTPPSMTTVGQGTVRRMTQFKFPVPLLRTNVKPARSKRVRVPL